MDATPQEKLAAKVKAVNKTHRAANEVYAQLRQVFEPLVGQKILKADGTFLASVQKLMPQLPNRHDLIVYRNSSHYTLVFGVRASEPNNNPNGPHTIQSHEVHVYIGDLKGPVLDKLYEPENRRTDYTPEEVIQKRETYRKAKAASDRAHSELLGFGEYDL